MVSLLGFDLLMGLLVGFIMFFGGYGMGVVWSKLFIECYGFINVMEVVMVCVMFGLVLGGLIGGLVVCYLVKYFIMLNGISDDQEVLMVFEKLDVGCMIILLVLIEIIVLIVICLMVGKIVV